MLAVVIAVDARRIQAVVDRRLTVGAPEEPLRVCVVCRLLRLAQVEAADDAHAAAVGVAQDVTKKVAARGQEGAGIVKRHAGRVLRDDAAHVYEERIGANVRDRAHELLRIDRRICLAQVGLEEPNGFGHPPAGVSGGLGHGHHRGEDRRGQHHSGESGAPTRAIEKQAGEHGRSRREGGCTFAAKVPATLVEVRHCWTVVTASTHLFTTAVGDNVNAELPSAQGRT